MRVRFRPGSSRYLCSVLSFLSLLALFAGPAFGAGKKPLPPQNPRALIKTSMGDITVELFGREAPKTVANFLGLADGKKEFTDPKTGKKVTRPFYDGLIFHRVIKGFVIQGGDPLGNGTSGPGYTFADEINADALGLNKIPVFDKNNDLNPWLLIRTREQFQALILGPLFRKMGIHSQEELDKRKDEVTARLKQMTLKEAYENMGYRYSDTGSSHKPVRGSLAMANAGPNTNGSQFFITLADAEWLSGRHTVFGKVIKGMDVVDRIGNVKTDAQDKPIKDVRILSIRQIPASDNP